MNHEYPTTRDTENPTQVDTHTERHESREQGCVCWSAQRRSVSWLSSDLKQSNVWIGTVGGRERSLGCFSRSFQKKNFTVFNDKQEERVLSHYQTVKRELFSTRGLSILGPTHVEPIPWPPFKTNILSKIHMSRPDLLKCDLIITTQ